MEKRIEGAAHIFKILLIFRDYFHAFANEDGTDIQDGRLTWLIVLALQRANPEVKKLLYANYGFHDAEKVDLVKKV